MSRIISGLNTKSIKVPAYSVSTLDYLDTKPNYFKVQNRGNSKIYCGAASIPTATQYDFTVSAGKSQMHADPAQRSKFYIYNPSGSEIECVVTTFAAEFEPLTLALAGLELDASGLSVESSNVIESFNTSLPSGTNKIGTVGISDSLPAGNNKIGSVEVTGTVANLVNSILTAVQNMAWTNEKITALMSAIDNIEAGGGGTAAVRQRVYSGSGIARGQIVTPTGAWITELVFFSNDGETGDVTLYIQNSEETNDNVTITLKPGEVLNNVKMWSPYLAVNGAGSAPFRYCVNYEG